MANVAVLLFRLHAEVFRAVATARAGAETDGISEFSRSDCRWRSEELTTNGHESTRIWSLRSRPN
jgi:hypothetical protein